MNYQTVVDEVTSLLSPLLSPCHVSVSLLSLKENEEERGKKRRRRASRGQLRREDRRRGKRPGTGERVEY